MKKSERIHDMMIYLNPRDHFNLKDLMLRYNISKSTALRDVASLEAMGMPIYSEQGRHGGYGLLKNRLLSPMIFTIDEMYAMYFAMLTLNAYETTPFHLSIQKLEEKFQRCLSDQHVKTLSQMRNILKFDATQHPNSSPYLKEVLLAAVDERICRIRYDKKGTIKVYDVQFDEVLSRFGQWYTVGYNYNSAHHQVFRCDKILTFDYCDTYSPFTLDQLHEMKFKTFYKDVPIYFSVEIREEAIDMYYKEHYPNMSLHKEGEQHYIKGHFQEFELTFMSNYFMHYSSLIIAIEPPLLKQALIDKTCEKLEHFRKI